MPHRHIRTIVFFTVWGILHGLLLGGLCGTLIFPLVGSAYAAMWGLGIGVTLGVVVGVGVALTNALMIRTPYDLVQYRRHRLIGVGLFVAIGAGFLLVGTTQGFLWGAYTYGFFPYFLPSLAGAMFWGGLSAAYAASRYADWYTGLIGKVKTDIGVEDALPEKMGIMAHFARQAVKPDGRVIGLTVVLAVILLGINLTDYSRGYNSGGYFFSQLVMTVLYGSAILFTGYVAIVMTSGYLAVFIIRIYTLEYRVQHLPESLNIRPLVVSFLTLAAVVFLSQFFMIQIQAMTIVVGLLMLVLVVLVGMNMTEDFAGWYLEEKLKGKPKKQPDVLLPQTEIVGTRLSRPDDF